MKAAHKPRAPRRSEFVYTLRNAEGEERKNRDDWRDTHVRVGTVTTLTFAYPVGLQCADSPQHPGDSYED